MTVAKPPLNRRPYLSSGHYALKAALQRIEGEDWTEPLGDVGLVLKAYRAELLDALGGADAVSPQRRAIVDVTARTALMLDSLDSYILGLPSLVNKSKRQLFAVVRERQGLADTLVRHLSMLGLDRVKARKATAGEVLRGETGQDEREDEGAPDSAPDGARVRQRGAQDATAALQDDGETA